MLELHHPGHPYRARALSLFFKGKEADFVDGGRVSPFDGAPSQMTAAHGCWLQGEGLFPTHLLLQDLMAQQTVEFRDFHLVSSVPSHHCRQMAFIKLLSVICHLDSCSLLTRKIGG